MEVFTNLTLDILFWLSFAEFILILVLFYLVFKLYIINGHDLINDFKKERDLPNDHKGWKR